MGMDWLLLDLLLGPPSSSPGEYLILQEVDVLLGVLKIVRILPSCIVVVSFIMAGLSMVHWLAYVNIERQ
jgi:hypothetical protein